jgi:putative ABC transport system ATP-binding protein
MNSCVYVRNVRKFYGAGAGRVEALRGIDLAVSPGEFVAMTGPSGCGKTTLLHLLAGLDMATEGTVRVNGSELSSLDEDARTIFRGRHIGVVFQSFNLLDILTAVENVSLPLSLAGVSTREAASRARAALDRVGLGARAHHFPAELSGGEQQRVAIARGIVAEPALLLADEPTGNLDSDNGATVLQLLREQTGAVRRTVILVTHDLAIASQADRVIRLHDGRLVA